MCRHSAGLSLQVFIQGLCAAEQGARESPLESCIPLRPRQASQCLANNPAQELHIVEDHAELERCARWG